MKNSKIKLISLALSAVLLLGIAFAISVSADTTEGPKIISNNVQYGEKYALQYAVDATGLSGAVTLNIYAEDPNNGTPAPIKSITVDAPETIKIDGVETTAYVFTTPGVAAKNLTQIFYAQAEAGGVKGNITRYSVIEYMYERLSGQQEITANQATLYRAVIELASASTQVLINDKNEGTENDVTLASDYSYVYFPYGDGFVGETEGAADGYEAGIYPIGTTVYPKVAETATGNITVTVYDDNANVKFQKVIKNGAAYQLDGDMTIITAGGELPYSPDLTDTAGRLTFDNGETFSNYTIAFNDSKNKLETNSSAGVYNIVSKYPWNTESNVLQIKMSGNNTYYANVQNEKATADTKGVTYEVDIMFTTPSAVSTWSFNVVTGNAAATNTARAQIIVNTNGTLQFKDRETGDIVTLGTTTEQWFRLRVEYLNNSEDGIVANWYINDKFIDSTSRSGDTTAITSIYGLWIQTNGSMVGEAYMDYFKAELVK